MSHITNCPRCHGDLSSANVTECTTVCPHCQGPLHGIAGLRAPDVDTDVRAGLGVATKLLGVLILVNAAGIAAAFIGTNGLGLAIMFVPLFGLLDVLVIAAILPPWWRRYRHWLQSRGSDEITVGCGLLMLTVGVIAAVVIVFFSACLGLLALKEM